MRQLRHFVATDTWTKNKEIRTRFGTNVPPCKNNKRHKWKKGSDEFGETGICLECGYDAYDQQYKKI